MNAVQSDPSPILFLISCVKFIDFWMLSSFRGWELSWLEPEEIEVWKDDQLFCNRSHPLLHFAESIQISTKKLRDKWNVQTLL